MAKPAMSPTLKKSMISVAMLLLFASRKSIGGDVVVKMGCSGKLGDCLWEKGKEMEMESETSRRVLWAAHKKYISYEALKRDVVPCSKPGVPYYNCRALPKASPYSRGCEAISECRGG
ncbi:protein RALF-like 33 [Phoenix dactylifera]|uniref:Protein RALF-like 33 n=1 Tax=Phoenix dactylifera TaxID=42345 RepID=A0A8B7D4W8_PHODC|nr:protein RALF-like 33 [Phoenix dactylifera]